MNQVKIDPKTDQESVDSPAPKRRRARLSVRNEVESGYLRIPGAREYCDWCGLRGSEIGDLIAANQLTLRTPTGTTQGFVSRDEVRRLFDAATGNKSAAYTIPTTYRGLIDRYPSSHHTIQPPCVQIIQGPFARHEFAAAVRAIEEATFAGKHGHIIYTRKSIWIGNEISRL